MVFALPLAPAPRYGHPVCPMAPPSRIPKGTGPRIKARRQQLGLTQKKVARAVAEKVQRDYGESWLAQIERDKGAMLLDAAIALADVLAMSMDDMLGRRMGADIILEPTEDEVMQRLVSAAVEPLEAALGLDSAAPIPLEPRRRGRARAGGRPPRT